MNEIEFTELPKLTMKENNFLFHYFTDALKDRAKAYKLSYDCENSSEKTIYEEASKLLKNPKITPWIAHYEKALQDFQENEIKYTRQDFMNELDRIRSKTEDSPKTIGIALKAVELKGKTSGHLKDNVELSGNTTVQMGSIEVGGKEMAFNIGTNKVTTNNNATDNITRNAEYSSQNAPDDNGVQ